MLPSSRILRQSRDPTREYRQGVGGGSQQSNLTSLLLSAIASRSLDAVSPAAGSCDHEHIADPHLRLPDRSEDLDRSIRALDSILAGRAGCASGHAESALRSSIAQNGSGHGLEESHAAHTPVPSPPTACAA